jgi:ABC-type glycerol-3-phosphate transport system substrate-binding protein
MKKTVVFLAAALCLITAAQVFGGGQGARPAASGGAKETTLTMINRVNADVVIDNNPLIKFIREKTGFNIQLEAPPINNYNDRLQIIMASGDLPDLVYVWSLDQNYIRWAEDGLLVPIEEQANKYPNIKHNITPELFEAARIPSTGLAYGVPRTNIINHTGTIINTQWLAKLGMKAPTTIDEFYEYGKKVATGDPDGNGRNDTYLLSPIANVWGSVSGVILNAFLPTVQFGAPDFDGQYKIREKMNGYYPYLDFMRKLYAESILDPEYFINKIYADRDKAIQGRIALFSGHQGNIPENPLLNNNGALDKFDLVPPIKSSDGKSRNYVYPAIWGVWALPASSKKTEDALRFLDWGNSPEGLEVFWFGIKGQTYNSYDLKTRILDQTDAQRSALQTISSSYMTVSFAYEGLAGAVSSNQKILNYYNTSLDNYLANVQEASIPTVNFPEWDAFRANNPDLITRKEELENKYVIGDISQTELRTFINNEWLPKSAQYEAAYLKLMAARK